MALIKPMLASEVTADEVKFPVYGSAKLDGVRGIVTAGVLLSRSHKPIPNLFVQQFFKDHPELEGLDGELIIGEPNAGDVYRVTCSGVMSIKGEPDFSFYVFDWTGDANMPYNKRIERILAYPSNPRVVILPQQNLSNKQELDEYEETILELGYEGLILRSIDGYYKEGRSSVKQGLLLKYKRFSDAECEIVGFQEEMENTNKKFKDELGHSARSSHQEGMVPKGTLGALEVRGLNGTFKGVAFKIGTGFDAKDRKDFWKNRQNLIGKTVKYKYFEVGVKDAPRFPVFLGFRDKIDMS